MGETNIKIEQAHLSLLWQKWVKRANTILVFFSLRKRRKYWGVVYDSISKQPLDPVIVKLVYADGNEVETCVTDMAGRYGFLARPGKFKILPKKSNYRFPSQLVAGDADGIYNHLYHGEFFELSEDYEVIGPNIPMDPVSADWNQQAKLNVVKTHAFRDYLLKRLIAVVFWFGLAFDGLYIALHASGKPVTAWAVGIVYLLLFFLAVATPEIRLWSVIRQKVFNQGTILLELHNPVVPSVVFGKTAMLPDGKFFLRANPGSYQLFVNYQDKTGVTRLLGSVPVVVDNLGVVSTTLVIKGV